MPAPPKNRNATRHGLRAGELPKGASYIKRECDVLRREIESAVADAHGGSVSLYQAALIQTCVRWERHAMLVQRWLRLQADTMGAATRLAYSRDIARASAERDKALLGLGLHASDSRSIIDALYSSPHEPEPEENADSECERAECDSSTKDNHDCKANTEEATHDSHGDDGTRNGHDAPETGPNV